MSRPIRAAAASSRRRLALAHALQALAETDAAPAREDYRRRDGAMAGLRAPLDAFFDTVTVNARSRLCAAIVCVFLPRSAPSWTGSPISPKSKAERGPHDASGFTASAPATTKAGPT